MGLIFGEKFMKKSLLASSVALMALAIQPAMANDTTPHQHHDMLVHADDQGTGDADDGVKTTAKDYWGDWGVNTDYVDTNVKPGDDFNMYVNGKWIDDFEIPADRPRYNNFTLLAEKSEQRVKKIIDELAAEQPDPSTLQGKIAAYYNSYMDVDAINAAGLAPAQPMITKIFSAKNMTDLVALMAEPGIDSPIGGYVNVDSKNPDSYIFYMVQSGLGLPDRDMYLQDNPKYEEFRTKYKEYLAFLFGKLGYQDPKASAQAVFQLEKDIAKLHWDRTISRNRDLTYNRVSQSDLLKMAGDFPLKTMLKALKLDLQKDFVVSQMPPTAEEIAELKLDADAVEKTKGGVPALMQMFSTVPMANWQAYMAVHYLQNNASVLPSDIDNANFEFYGKTLSGQEEQRKRWQRAVAATEGALGEGIGKVYAERYFPPENKAAMVDLVENLRKAMGENLKEITWMGDDTKKEARDKLAKFTPKIGYTEKFETYDDLTVAPNNAFANSIAAGKWAINDNLKNLGKPVDKTEWFMLPQTVNAYYSPPRNEIVFPAAILQPPFFNLSADPAVNYGGIGAVIGHELGHGFDDQGAKSDGDGVLRNW